MKDKNSVLIVGSYGSFVEELIIKLNKEGWRIYTLVSGTQPGKPAHVFEQYCFDYESESVREVMASCHPGTVLYTGAHDPLYGWTEKKSRTEAGKYVADLYNVLLSARESHVRHFVYLSSECVFGESGALIPEDEPLSPTGFRGLQVAQGENLASSFRAISGMEVTIVRLADLYVIPKSAGECESAVARLCLEALRGETVQVDEQRIFAPLFAADAAHALYLLLSAPSRAHAIYHVAARAEITESAIVRAIGEAFGAEVPIVDRSKGETKRRVLSGERICAEFGFEARTPCDRTIQQIVAYMRAHRNQFGVQKGGKTPLRQLLHRLPAFAKLLPYLECLALFFPFYLLSGISSAYLRSVDFLLIFILLFALQRGRVMAIFAFFLSVVGFFAQQMRSEDAAEFLINAGTYTWIAQAFALGLFTGYLRDKLTQTEKEKNEEIRFLSARLEEIAAINQSNTRIKNYFEERAINSSESIGWFYEVISELDSADSGEVLFIATRVLASVMGTGSVALYAVSSEYLRLTAATTPRARALGKSIRISQFPEIDRLLRSNKVFINKAMDEGMPSMISSLLDADGSMRIVILLWDMPYENMTLYYANMLKVVGSLILNAVIRSANYMDALAYRRYLPGTHILKRDAYEEMLNIYQKQSLNNLTEYCVLEVATGGMPPEEMSEKLDGLIRNTDIVGMISEGSLGVLLVNSTREDATSVAERLTSAGIAVRSPKEENGPREGRERT